MRFQMNGWQDDASGGNNMGHHSLCAGILCFPVGYACACIRAISVCESKRVLSFPSAVRVPGSIQHLDQQVCPSCTSTLTHSTDLHLPAEGEATQLLTFPRLRIQAVSSYCNRVPAKVSPRRTIR